MYNDFLRPTLAIVGGSITWVAQMVADAVPPSELTWVQAIIKEVGLPSAMLVLVVYGIVALYKELKLAQTGRLTDRDTFQQLLLEITAKTNDRQERQIVATDNLSSEFAHLADKINQCQTRPKP